MTANNPTPYQRHTEADQHHEDLTRLPDLCRRGLHDLSDPDNVRHKTTPGGGLARQCKPCSVQAQRRWREKNRDRYNTTVRERRNQPGEHRERRLAAQRAYHHGRDRCRRGHLQDGAIRYVRPVGRRECRRCRRRYQAAWRARRVPSANTPG